MKCQENTDAVAVMSHGVKKPDPLCRRRAMELQSDSEAQRDFNGISAHFSPHSERRVQIKTPFALITHKFIRSHPRFDSTVEIYSLKITERSKVHAGFKSAASLQIDRCDAFLNVLLQEFCIFIEGMPPICVFKCKSLQQSALTGRSVLQA